MTHPQKVSAAIAQMQAKWQEIVDLENLLENAASDCQKWGKGKSETGDYVATLKINISAEYSVYRAISLEREMMERAWQAKDKPKPKPTAIVKPYFRLSPHNSQMYKDYEQNERS